MVSERSKTAVLNSSSCICSACFINSIEGRHSVDTVLKTALLQTQFQQDWCLQQNAPVVIIAWSCFVFLKKNRKLFQYCLLRSINLYPMSLWIFLNCTLPQWIDNKRLPKSKKSVNETHHIWLKIIYFDLNNFHITGIKNFSSLSFICLRPPVAKLAMQLMPKVNTNPMIG